MLVLDSAERYRQIALAGSPPMILDVSRMVLERYVSRSSSERLLALVLASFASPDGTSIYPSIDTLAKMTGLSRSTVRRLIAEWSRVVG